LLGTEPLAVVGNDYLGPSREAGAVQVSPREECCKGIKLDANESRSRVKTTSSDEKASGAYAGVDDAREGATFAAPSEHGADDGRRRVRCPLRSASVGIAEFKEQRSEGVRPGLNARANFAHEAARYRRQVAGERGFLSRPAWDLIRAECKRDGS